MKRLIFAVTLFAVLVLVRPVPLLAAPSGGAPAPGVAEGAPATQPAARPLTVAVLDFEAHDPSSPELGKQLSDILTALLSAENGFTLVDRGSLQHTLKEHEINMTGVVDTSQAIQVAKLVGARIIVTGRAFPIQKQLFMTAKIIGTETSLVVGVLVKKPVDTAPDELAIALAAEIANTIRAKGASLVAGEEVDPFPALKARLAGRKLPAVAVIVNEVHVQHYVIDPAVETEIKKMLLECGFTIQDVDQNDLAAWGKGMGNSDVGSWPRSLAKADLVITGAAFSEVGARIGNLVSCSGRAEINVIDRHEGKIVLADRVNTRGVDLAENAAAKKALENAGRKLGIDILQYFAKTLPAAEPGKK